MPLVLVIGIGAAVLLGVIAIVNAESNSGSTDTSNGIPAAPNAVVGSIANAIATAEGFFKGAGSVPFDQNNPGDLTDYASLYGANENGITIFPTLAAGWNALYEKIQNILSGSSDVYSPSMTISELGQEWADDAGEWANNVSTALGISSDTTLGEYATGQDSGDNGDDSN
jgi:hypothetical protein